ALQRVSTAMAFPNEKTSENTFEKTAEDFVKSLEGHYERLKPEGQAKILPLLRQARTFGMNPLKIELRETSEEYARVVALLLEKDPQGRDLNYSQFTLNGQRMDMYFLDGNQRKRRLDARRQALMKRYLAKDQKLDDAEEEEAQKILGQNQAW